MPLLPTLGQTFATGVRAVRALVRGSVRGGAWATRRVGDARARGANNEAGMVRLFDLHALSCAGDTLIAIGLAGTIFFDVPLGEARSKVAIYLLVTMVPFALLAPVVGPLLDHWRHGRRYALATTMLGRAFLAYVISDNLLGFGLYPAAFGVLALSRAYGVARSAAVPRLLPAGVGLSQVGARASVYGTFAGALVAPIGLAAFWFGPQWSLRVASVIFIIGMVVALRLPAKADSDPPEEMPRPLRTVLRLRRGNDRPLSGALVINTLIGSACLRLLYGFLLLYFAFAIKAGQLETSLLGREIGSPTAVALVGGALATGTFLSTAIGTRLQIRRPAALQSAGLTITAGVGVLALIFYNLGMVALLALVAATFSGISKLAIDASIQERVPERLRASAFGHSETVLMIAWVLGGAIGIIPLSGRLGVALAAAIAVAAALRAAWVATRLRTERLHGRPDAAPDPAAPTSPAAPAPSPSPGPAAPARRPSWPDKSDTSRRTTPTDPWPTAPTVAPRQDGAIPNPRDRGTDQTTVRHPLAEPSTELNPTLVDEPKTKRRPWQRKPKQPPKPPRSSTPPPTEPPPPARPDPAVAPPGFHVYRPSSADGPTPNGDAKNDR
ncbi:MFS transporter [Actinoplanes sp. NPDC049265]|uniref:MFS transporter n=1 Tax=Actinoplanes sp. NPDC049265 TaxID=3363902 RepID=UPI0037129CC6